METKYITISLENKEAQKRQKRRERLETVWCLAQVVIGVACFIGIIALLLGMAYEPIPARQPEVAAITTAAGEG